jgi:c-di-GMP-binding flagellar brake protein YcgR
MKFLVINEKDRDLLINYIFEKEREYLRQKKKL